MCHRFPLNFEEKPCFEQFERASGLTATVPNLGTKMRLNGKEYPSRKSHHPVCYEHLLRAQLSVWGQIQILVFTVIGPFGNATCPVHGHPWSNCYLFHHHSLGHKWRNLSRRRNQGNHSHSNKKEFELDMERILRGDDRRTTLMLKNIPNKYSYKLLLAAIDEQCRAIYDFVYLPIDFKSFNGKKMGKF